MSQKKADLMNVMPVHLQMLKLLAIVSEKQGFIQVKLKTNYISMCCSMNIKFYLKNLSEYLKMAFTAVKIAYCVL